MNDYPPPPDHAGCHDLAEYRDVVRSLRDAAVTAVDLVGRSDPAEERLLDLNQLAACGAALLARLVE